MLFKSIKQKITTLIPKGNIKGRVLFSYIPEPLLWKDNDRRFDGHSNKWESKEIARIFLDNEYIVDAINWSDSNYEINKEYDIFFDIYTNLSRINFPNKINTLKILHLTGSYGDYQNKAEIKRVKEFKINTKINYLPKRQVQDIEGYKKSIKIADYCSLIGNKHTLSTFPKNIRKKISLVTVSSSRLNFVKNETNYTNSREYLWFFGSGCVHKGLDLVINYFLVNKDKKLNIVGNVTAEDDFIKAYGMYLNKENIRYYGYLTPENEKFKNILRKCFAFISPSCSESISTSVVTCMEAGLYPIISIDTSQKMRNPT